MRMALELRERVPAVPCTVVHHFHPSPQSF
jgi:hypothetical protein